MIGVRRPLADAAGHLDAVEVGQAEVQQDDVRRPGGRLDQGLLAGDGLDHPVALGAEGDAQEAHHLRLVVDDEDGAGDGLAGRARRAVTLLHFPSPPPEPGGRPGGA